MYSGGYIQGRDLIQLLLPFTWHDSILQGTKQVCVCKPDLSFVLHSHPITMHAHWHLMFCSATPTNRGSNAKSRSPRMKCWHRMNTPRRLAVTLWHELIGSNVLLAIITGSLSSVTVLHLLFADISYCDSTIGMYLCVIAWGMSLVLKHFRFVSVGSSTRGADGTCCFNDRSRLWAWVLMCEVHRVANMWSVSGNKDRL